jgi:hypothetical protein
MVSSSSYAKEVRGFPDPAGNRDLLTSCHLLCVWRDAEAVSQRVTGVIVFIAENPVRPIHSNELPWLSKWYSQNSNVFVSHTHSLWTQTERKMSRRYGKVSRSAGTSLNEMLMLHEEQVFAWISAKTGLDGLDSGAAVTATASGVKAVKGREELVMSLEKPDDDTV